MPSVHRLTQLLLDNGQFFGVLVQRRAGATHQLDVRDLPALWDRNMRSDTASLHSPDVTLTDKKKEGASCRCDNAGDKLPTFEAAAV